MSVQQLLDAVRCLPTVVTKMIDAYLTESPHTWTAMDGLSVTQNEDGSTDIVSTTAIDNRLLVSSTTFADGHLKWSVDFRQSHIMQDDDSAYQDIGVTSAAIDRKIVGQYRNEPDEDDWLFLPVHEQLFFVCHNNNEIGRIDLSNQIADDETIFRIVFVADPFKGTVTAEFLRWKDGLFRSFDNPTMLVDASTDLRRLRPCIIIRGMTKTSVRSEAV